VPGAGAFGYAALSQALWAFGYLIELASTPLEAKIFWDDFQFIAGVGWFFGFLIFTLRYTGRRYTPMTWGFITAPAILFVILVLTNPIHGWLRTSIELIPGVPFSALIYDFTPLVWGWALYGYGIMLLGILLLIIRFIRSQQLFRIQILIIITGTVIPIISTVLTLVGVTLSFHRDTTPVTFAISNILVAWGLFRYQLFAVAPVGRSVVVENLPGAVVVLDAHNRVVDFNRSAQQTIGLDYPDILGLPVAEAFKPWSELVTLYEQVEDLSTEITVMTPDGPREYEFSVTPLRNRLGRLTGRVVVVRDITARKAAEAELRRHRDNLEEMVAARTTELQTAVLEAQQLNVNLGQQDVILRAVSAATERLLKTTDWEHDIDDVLALLGQAMDVDSVTLFRKHFDEEGTLRAHLTNEWCDDSVASFMDDPRFTNVDVIGIGYSRMLEMWNEGRAFYGRVSDLSRRERALQRMWGIVSFVHMPIFVRDTLWGMASFNLMSEERTWSTAIIESLHSAANILGAVIERQMAQQALRRYAERLRVLREIDQTILAAESPEAIAKAALVRIQELVPCERASVVLIDLNADLAIVLAAQPDKWLHADIKPFRIIKNLHIAAPPGMLKCLVDGEVYVGTREHERESLSQIESMLLAEGIQTYVNIPLILQGELVGLLNFGLSQETTLSSEHMEAAQAIADQLAIAIQQARLHEQIRQYAAELELRVAERTKELEVANANLRALSTVKDEFVSNVSHELRTPITSLRLYHELLVKRPERQDEYIQALQRETQRLNTLVEDILTLSRMDQDRSQLVYDTVDINTLTWEYVQDRTLLAQDSGLTLKFDEGVGPLMVVADRNLLGQVISVLLTNAMNYTPSGGEITVRAKAAQFDGQNWVGIQVHDTGPGIPQEEQRRIFTRFYRGKIGRESGIPGTGLGLAIAYEIVERHMGRLEVHSSGIEGEGTVFNVWLPLPDNVSA
jgi:PAS domain S-box-containing protein